MKKLFIIAVILVVIIFIGFKFGANTSQIVIDNTIIKNDNFCGRSSFAYCTDDEQCVPSGCGFQLCGAESEAVPLPEKCAEKSCYNATKYAKECVCYKSLCQWKDK